MKGLAVTLVVISMCFLMSSCSTVVVKEEPEKENDVKEEQITEEQVTDVQNDKVTIYNHEGIALDASKEDAEKLLLSGEYYETYDEVIKPYLLEFANNHARDASVMLLKIAVGVYYDYEEKETVLDELSYADGGDHDYRLITDSRVSSIKDVEAEIFKWCSSDFEIKYIIDAYREENGKLYVDLPHEGYYEFLPGDDVTFNEVTLTNDTTAVIKGVEHFEESVAAGEEERWEDAEIILVKEGNTWKFSDLSDL